VVYGLVGLKTHAKICLVVRREDDGIRRYVHLGTGNYNDTTAKIYVDTGYFTSKESFGQDCSSLFNTLTGYSKMARWNKIAVAPVTLRTAFLRLVENETVNVLSGKPGGITLKLNSLSDTEVIQALYNASHAGVKIKLLVRGICCLKTGITGVSENIEVSGIVDRFLEHDRIFYFENGGNPRIFLSSADLMPRNLDRRVEVLFPIDDAALKMELLEILRISFSDNTKRRVQRPDGKYKKPSHRGQPAVNSQQAYYDHVTAAYDKAMDTAKRDIFRPVESKNLKSHENLISP
jgi:polyphosphate kinase